MMINKIWKLVTRGWKFIKEKWLVLLGILGGVIVALNFLNKKSFDKDVQQSRTKEKIEDAENREKEKIETAKQLAAAEKLVQDAQVKEEAVNKQKRIDEEVNEKIEESVKDTQQLASDFASTFGGKYVKNDEK